MYLLFVEDDEHIREVVTIYLNQSFPSLEVRTAVSNEEAIMQVQKQKPTIVLLDWLLTDGPATAFISWFEETFPRNGIPVILVSAMSKPETVANMHRIAGIVRKPFPFEELEAAIRTHWHQ